MHGLTPETTAFIRDLAARFAISESAVTAMLTAVKRGHVTMAQFDIGELGGSGQWMRGGMTMVGDMFNHGLKQTVDTLCNDLAEALSSGRIDLPSETGGQGSSWWPQWLGVPSATGVQNDGAYAVFPSQHCLAIRDASGVTLFDTQDHVIHGVGQQQGAGGSLTFSSQRGSFAVSSLRRLDRSGEPTGPSGAPSGDQRQGADTWSVASGLRTPDAPAMDSTMPVSAPAPSASVEARLVDAADAAPRSATPGAQESGQEIVALIEKLAALRTAGILTEDEFAAKKTELLKRL